jgi:hypothetical protein
MEDMISYTEAAMERAMKVEEVILRAVARKITWWQAAEIIGISDRQMRRAGTLPGVRDSRALPAAGETIARPARWSLIAPLRS